MDREQHRAEFEALEAAEPVRTTSGAAFPFSRAERAQAFAALLAREAQIEVEVIRLASCGSPGEHAPTWDLAVPSGQHFAVTLYYRLHDRRISPAALPTLPPATRLGALTDMLYSRAMRASGWSDQACSAADLDWFCGVAKLPLGQVRGAVTRARERFYAQHAGEKTGAVWIGIACLLVGGAMCIPSGLVRVGGGFVAAFGVAFLIFSLTRKSNSHR